MRRPVRSTPVEGEPAFDSTMTIAGLLLAGRYRLLAVLGEGGMAVVHRAHDELLDREVAVKQLRPNFASDPEFVRRFRQEARNAAALVHPNIATVYDTGTDGDIDYIVMQLVQGPDLEQVLAREGRLAPGAAVRIGIDVARALRVAHDNGIIHRDIKPGNILLDRDGTVRVVDFGIARAATDVGITTAGVVLGSVQYASPEQVTGEAVTPASDIYSLGVVLYETLTGRRPFSGPTPAAVALERLRVTPPPPGSVVADLPPSLDGVVMRALERDPAARYESAGDFASALEAWRIEWIGGVRRSGALARDAGAAGVALGTATTAGGATASGPVGAAHAGVSGARSRASEVAAIRAARAQRRGPREERPAARRRPPPIGILVPLAALALVVAVGAALAGALTEDRGGVLGVTASPPGMIGAADPRVTPTPRVTASPTPPSAAPSPSAAAIVSPPPTPAPTAPPTARPTRAPTPEPTPLPTRRPTAPPEPTQPPATREGVPALDPAETVARFYEFVVAEQFDAAAALWTSGMRERYPTAEYIDGRFAPTTEIVLQRNEIVAFDPTRGTATVAVDIIEYREGSDSPRRFVGDWDLVFTEAGWRMSDPDF